MMLGIDKITKFKDNKKVSELLQGIGILLLPV